MIVKALKSLFWFLFPIVKQVVLETALEEANKKVYPNSRRSYTPYNRLNRSYTPRPRNSYADMTPRRPVNTFVDEEALANLRAKLTGETNAEPFHDVLMVAFDLKGRDAETVHRWLQAQMPRCGEHVEGYVRGDGAGTVDLDSWWVANDERFDGSDTDSAVFVPKGTQERARNILKGADFRDDLVTCVACRSTQDGVHRIDCVTRNAEVASGLQPTLQACSECTPVNGRHAYYCDQPR